FEGFATRTHGYGWDGEFANLGGSEPVEEDLADFFLEVDLGDGPDEVNRGSRNDGDGRSVVGLPAPDSDDEVGLFTRNEMVAGDGGLGVGDAVLLPVQRKQGNQEDDNG
ncbi:MAG: hypothetical protein N2F24_04975, partial [Deltaproteobacteria bacterium]